MVLNGGFPKLGVPFLGVPVPSNKDYRILRSILGSPYLGKLPNALGICRDYGKTTRAPFKHSAGLVCKTLT